MKHALAFVFAILLLASIAYCAPADNIASDAKSALGKAFDKVVGDASLTVKIKDPSKQSGSQSGSPGEVAASFVARKLEKKK